MGKSWELTDAQKSEIQQHQKEIGAQYDPETGKRFDSVETPNETDDENRDERELADERVSPGENDNIENTDGPDNGRDDDGDIR